MKLRIIIFHLLLVFPLIGLAQAPDFQFFQISSKPDQFLLSDAQQLPAQLNFHFSPEVKLISVAGADGSFLRSFHVSEHGEVISSGFMPNSYFLPNNNLFVIMGDHRVVRDSFNPYGARDMGTMLLFGTLNNFISRLRIGGR